MKNQTYIRHTRRIHSIRITTKVHRDCFAVSRAVPNRRSLVFDQIWIIKTIILLNINRILIVALNFVNVNIVILNNSLTCMQTVVCNVTKNISESHQITSTTHWFPNSEETNKNPVFSTHIAAATGTVSKYFRRISVTYKQKVLNFTKMKTYNDSVDNINYDNSLTLFCTYLTAWENGLTVVAESQKCQIFHKVVKWRA